MPVRKLAAEKSRCALSHHLHPRQLEPLRAHDNALPGEIFRPNGLRLPETSSTELESPLELDAAGVVKLGFSSERDNLMLPYGAEP